MYLYQNKYFYFRIRMIMYSKFYTFTLTYQTVWSPTWYCSHLAFQILNATPDRIHFLYSPHNNNEVSSLQRSLNYVTPTKFRGFIKNINNVSFHHRIILLLVKMTNRKLTFWSLRVSLFLINLLSDCYRLIIHITTHG